MAAFPLTVTTDLYGNKFTSSLDFTGVPALSDLILAVERNFEREVRANIPGSLPFKVQTMQVYDDVLQRWTDLYNPSQLKPGAQVFVFQPSVPLPPQVSDVAVAGAVADYLGSPSRARITSELGINAALSEKLRRLYAEIEVNKVLPMAGLRDYFTKNGITWTASALGDLVNQTDALSFVDWARWGMRNAAVIDSLYFTRFAVRLDKPVFTIPDHVPPTTSEMDNIAARRAREEELRRAYTLGWTAEREAIDRQYRAQRKAELDLQIRHLTTKNKLDRIRAAERADADAASLSLAMIANAASPPRRRDDLCRMYYSPASPNFGYLSPAN